MKALIVTTCLLTGLCSPAGVATAHPQPTPKDQTQLPAGAVLRVGHGHGSQVAGLGLLDNGRTLLTSAKDDTLRLWDLASGKSTGRIVAPHSRPKSIAVRPDGKVLAVLAPDGKLQLLELPRGKLLKEWQAETVKNVGSVAFSPDGKWVVSNGMNTRLWDVATGKLLHHFKHPPEPMSTLVFSPDGKLLCMGSASGMIRLWDAHTGQELGQLAGHTRYIDQVAFSPDGKLLASVSHDDTARLWDLDTRKEIRSFQVNFGVALALSRDGRSLAAGGAEGIIRVWETASGQERAAFHSNSGCVMVLLFSPNGKTLISGHVQSTALCWDLTGRGPDQQRVNKALSAEELEKEWQHLGGEARRAFRAIWILAAAAEQAVAKARKELQPVKAVDDKVIARCITDLGSAKFAVREKAMAELKKAGDQAWPALRKVLAGTSLLETKMRARQLLDMQFNPPPDRLRLIRSLEVLEHIDNREARALLQALSNGAPRAWLTQEATRMLQRMKGND
ncbi:MAG: WD40 repeat domain-containing protein [Gemmataceae bacterium]|nr:WD40 repeat domain-containing protein [Gemmataceae bacterium]